MCIFTLGSGSGCICDNCDMHSRKDDIFRYPESAKRLIKKGMFNEVKSVMSEKEFDKHFTPPYNPWEQRFCLAPGGDFFKPIRCRDS